jgi:hypothetical protein
VKVGGAVGLVVGVVITAVGTNVGIGVCVGGASSLWMEMMGVARKTAVAVVVLLTKLSILSPSMTTASATLLGRQATTIKLLTNSKIVGSQ